MLNILHFTLNDIQMSLQQTLALGNALSAKDNQASILLHLAQGHTRALQAVEEHQPLNMLFVIRAPTLSITCDERQQSTGLIIA
ncbi:hypothetical protein ASE07_11700 [Noviherbaspirillum sp. Root189]|nr:hypothetical protein ASE07_11700 [Noviherbaspirillum sp. Root189]